MATDKYLLGAEKFKEITPVHGNVDNDLINQSILACQDLFILPTIGTGLMDYIEANLSSLGSSYVILLENYIHPAMKYWVMADLTQTLSHRFTNIGLVNKTGENVQPADSETIRRERNRYMKRAILYANKLYDYLLENSSTFPLFDNPGTGYDIVHPSRRLHNTGFFLGGYRGKMFRGLDIYDDKEHFRN